MKLIFQKTVQEEKEIELPIFFKEPNSSYVNMIGIFAVDDIREVCVLPKTKWVQFRSEAESFKLEAWLKWQPITEEEFIQQWEAALQSLSFKATLIEKEEDKPFEQWLRDNYVKCTNHYEGYYISVHSNFPMVRKSYLHEEWKKRLMTDKAEQTMFESAEWKAEQESTDLGRFENRD